MEVRCDICTGEIPASDDVCPTCGIPRGDSRESTRAAPSEETPWTVVRTVSTVIEAELMAGRLRNEGLPAIVLSQVDTTRNLTVGGLAVAKVYVRAFDHAEADAILSVDADSIEFDFDDDDDNDEEG